MPRHFVTLIGLGLLFLLPILGATAPGGAKGDVPQPTTTVIQDGASL